MLSLFFHGIALGLAIAAPVGPIGVLCIRQTLANGLLTGLVAGLGAATADSIYGSIAGFGLSAISDILVNQQTLFKLVGGTFLVYLGVKTFLSKTTSQTVSKTTSQTASKTASKIQAIAPQRRTLLKTYGSTLLLTLTNPATILSFTAIFAGLGLANQAESTHAALTLVLGVFCGSALWWLTLSSSVALLRHRFSLASMGWINRISGSIITAFGIIALLSSIQTLP